MHLYLIFSFVSAIIMSVGFPLYFEKWNSSTFRDFWNIDVSVWCSPCKTSIRFFLHLSS